ncbi:hypothetical protein, partial [Pseudomonas aeruginosa]
FFGGALEVLAAALLWFRRTATLGALVAAAVLGNVVLLNLCYDVPVKQFALWLLLLSLVVLLPDLPRLFDLLVRGRPVSAP